MYFIEQKYYNDGRLTVRILKEKAALKKGYTQKMSQKMEGYDLYVDVVRTMKEAKAFVREIQWD